MKTACLGLLFVFALTLPASAQQYNYSYGNSRVVRPSDNGLARPSATYIGSGTLSKTAQGLSPSGNPDLPNVNYGANITTPGDNQYRPKQPRQSRRRTNRYYNPYYQQQQPNYYVPGQNQQSAQYGQNRSNYGYTSTGGGVATYNNQSYGGGQNNPNSRNRF